MTKYISDAHLFGGCPACGRLTGILNVGASHWGYCGRHRLRWWVGSDLFPGWRRQDPGEWTRNAFYLRDFAPVAPRRRATRICACCGAVRLGRLAVPHSARCPNRIDDGTAGPRPAGEAPSQCRDDAPWQASGRRRPVREPVRAGA